MGDSRFLRCDARHARDVALRAGGRAFDVVLANPPFVAGGSSRFAAGGDDGCRVLEPLVRTMAAHVGRGGYACVVSEFYASSERPEGWVPPCPGLDALLVRDPRQAENPRDYAAGRGLPADGGEGLRRRGVVAVCSGLLVLRPVHALRETKKLLDVADGAAEADALALESFLERPSATTRVTREAMRFVWRDPDAVEEPPPP